MTTAYPGALDTYTTKVDGVDDVVAAHINNVQDAILGIQTELGVDPAGSAADLVTRLAKALSAAGLLNFAASTTLTISGGAITATQNWHRIDTEGAAASDELISITAGTDGQILFLRTVDSARNVNIAVGGNIVFGGDAASMTLDYNSDLAILIYDANLAKWICQRFLSVTGVNAWSGEQLFYAAIRTAFTTVSANTTLGNNHHTVAVDASSAAITITLPAALYCIGRRYEIKKVDSSANAVTIDGNGAETIDGASTHVLSAQYAGVTIISTGSGWFIVP